MGSKERGPLTEAMFYTLMAFLKSDVCGTEIAEAVSAKTGGRVHLGPGTLYTILGRFLDEGLITEIAVDGRKRTYRLTDKGREMYRLEVERLRRCLDDAEKEEEI